MKWLFAVLVALNIIVFGGMVASRVAEKQKTVVAPTVPIVAAPQQELNPPPAPSGVPQPEILQPDWISKTEPAPAAASEPLDDEVVLAAMAQKAKEEAAAKEKKEREEKAKREQLEKEKAAREKAAEQPERRESTAAATGGQCVSTASITLDEDDYHRIKGLLQQWPHAASRTVEKRSNAGKKAAQTEKTYRVLVSAGDDAVAQLDHLASKGFSGSLYEGDISVGVTRSRSAAQVLISRLSTAGFGGTRILEQGSGDNAGSDRSLSVAKMNVTFLSVDEKNAQAIQNVVDRYGRLNRRPCR